MYLTCLAIEERVIRRRVTLNRDRVECRNDILDLRPKKLGCRAQCIPVLPKFSLILCNRHILLVPGRQFASLQKVPDGSRNLNLSRVRASDLVNERVVVRTNAEQRLRSHGRAYLSEQREVDSIMKCKRRHGGRESRPVHDT